MIWCHVGSELIICTRCILDSTASDIWFDESGVCKYCKIHDEMEKTHPLGEEGAKRLRQLLEKIKKEGINKEHDCIVGVSGGRDSTFTLLTAVRLGLRPLAVHFDNGWNSEISVSNIKKATSKLGVDLHTVVADWEEFKDLQVAFLKASVPDADIPSDYAIYSVLYQVAAQEGIKYILNGHSFRTEGTAPISWTYMDGRYINSVLRAYGKNKKIRSFPVMSMSQLLYFVFIKGIKEIRLLEYLDYRKKDVDKVLSYELDWEYYGGHHHENTYTEFFQSFLLPKKFNIDKRKIELSALIRSGQISRKDALNEVQRTRYESNKEIIDYTISKLCLSQEVFEEIYRRKVRTFNDYPTYYPLIRTLRIPIAIACKFRLLPQILYLKYAK